MTRTGRVDGVCVDVSGGAGVFCSLKNIVGVREHEPRFSFKGLIYEYRVYIGVGSLRLLISVCGPSRLDSKVLGDYAV